jgi:hypothetical protein
MKAMAIIGYILAALALTGGLAISTNGSLPMQGFSAVIGGAAGAFMLALPSTALIGIVQIRNILKPDHANDYKGWKAVSPIDN